MRKTLLLYAGLLLIPSIGNALIPAKLDWQHEAWEEYDEMHKSYEQNFDLCSDQQLNQYVNQLLSALLPNNKDIEIYIENSLASNAMSHANGRIYINLGLFVVAESESELTAIIAHEIAHIQHDHFSQDHEAAKQRNRNNTIAKAVGFGIGGVAVGLSNSYAASKFSIEQEHQADATARALLKQGGFNQLGQAQMFARMKADDMHFGLEERKYFSTHPMTDDRVAISRAQLKDYRPPSTAVIANTPYAKIRTQALKSFIAVSFTNNSSNATIAQLQQKNYERFLEEPEVIYGLAAAYKERGWKLKDSVKQWRKWHKKGSTTQSEPTSDDANTAIALYQKLLARDKDHIDANYDLASLYIQQGKSKESLPLLKRFLALAESTDNRRAFAEHYFNEYNR